LCVFFFNVTIILVTPTYL